MSDAAFNPILVSRPKNMVIAIFLMIGAGAIAARSKDECQSSGDAAIGTPLWNHALN